MKLQKALCQFAVEFQAGARHTRGRRVLKVGVYFSAAYKFTQRLADLWLQYPEFFGDPEADFKVSVVDRAEFPGQAPECILAFSAGESCHTSDHESLPI